MTERRAGWLRVIATIDKFTDVFSAVASGIILVLVLIVTYEVAARYLFHAPTRWAFDMTYMIYGTFFMLGAAYALRRGAHIRTDLLWAMLSPRWRAAIDFTAYVLFFFPAISLLFLTSVDDAWHSWVIGERSEQSSWRPYLFIFKSMMPLALFLLLVQGIAELLKSWYAILRNEPYAEEEKIEI